MNILQVFLTFEESKSNKVIFIFISLVASNFSERLLLSIVNLNLYWARVDFSTPSYLKNKNFLQLISILHGHTIYALFQYLICETFIEKHACLTLNKFHHLLAYPCLESARTLFKSVCFVVNNSLTSSLS